jgi:hypothetical protein
VPIKLMRGDTLEEHPVGDPEHAHRPMISIVDELKGGAKAASTGESGARTAKLMAAILAGYRRSHSV